VRLSAELQKGCIERLCADVEVDNGIQVSGARDGDRQQIYENEE